MALISILATVFVAGAVGGLVNAAMSDNGFALPKWEDAGGTRVLRPGWTGNVFVSGVAACVSWGLYGPFASSNIIGGVAQSTAQPPGLTLSGLVGAVLVGIAGARWLTNEVDKHLLRAAGARAATKPANEPLAAAFGIVSPAELLRMTKD